MSLVLRSQRAFSESNGNLPQYANVRSCNCCPYGYHIDLDFVRYCEALANAKPSEEELQRRSRRRSRKSMEFMLGLDSIFDQWDAGDRQQTLTELPQENELDSPYHSLQRTPSFTSTSCQYQPLRQRSSSVPRFTYSSQNSHYPRSESPFGTASSSCSSYRGAESDVPYPMRKPAVSPPETKAFLHDALDEVCSDFERTLERASAKRKKLGQKHETVGRGVAGKIFTPGLNSYLSMDRNNNHANVMSLSYQEKSRNGGWSWDSASYINRDSCVGGNKSPRASRSYTKPLPFQQKLSPAEQQYESYVKATVAANAKSPVEEILSPPAPPPRRHTLTAKLTLTSPSSALTTTDSVNSSSLDQSTPSSLVSPTKEAGAAAGSSADAQTLFNIRQQMALSLKRMKDLEEQVKTIPDLKSELSQLRKEKQQLQQTVKSKDEELQKAKESSRFSSSPSPVFSSKTSSPVQFQPQRVSPISLESMGARMRAPSTSTEKVSKSVVFKRDVATMCSKQTTRDIAVGSPIPASKSLRDVGCNAGLTKSINENLFTKTDVEERIKLSIRQHEEQKKLARLRDLISVGTQMYVAKKETKNIGAQTKPEKQVQKHNVGVMAQAATRESFTNCKPDVRSVGSSNDRITDLLCEKCLVTKRSIACATEDENKLETAKTISLKLLDMPARSNTFCLGDNEKLNVAKKSIGTQYIPITQHSAGCQTLAKIQHTVAVQSTPQVQNCSTQFDVCNMSRQTDTKDLIRLSTSQTNTEEIAPPTPLKKEKPCEPVKPVLQTKACNTDVKNYKDNSVNTLPPVTTNSTSCNTEEINKRDIACGDKVKPHISIACADNYCDSCKDAIKNLAKGFSKVLASPVPVRAIESKIPRPKNLPSPSPVRKQFSRQNTYTITPSPTPSPVAEKKNMASSLQEKSCSSSFHQLESSGESQSFITEPVSLSAITIQNLATTAEEKSSSSNSTPGDSPQRKSLYDLSQLGENELIVREEKRVSISWSRDNSPAPTSIASTSKPSTEEEKLKEQIELKTITSSKEISQGARKKILLAPLESSHESKNQTEATQQEEETPQKPPPSKALLQKIAMKETEPRKKITPPKEMLAALKTINSSLLKKLGSKPISSLSLKSAKQTIQQEWFGLSSSENANPHEVEDYLDCFEELSVSLLEYCVNMVDANGNTAMHYAVSHGNFDVVSILLDSKVCNVNQMNNAGYTCVMLVSLAKLKNPEHRTVVERLFQMADVNIRAKKHCQTALMLAVSHGNLEMVQLLLAAGADINIQDEDGSTALMCAAEHGRSDIVKHLLTHPDCDSLIQDVDGSTAFKIAWQAGHRDIGIFLYVHEQMMRSKMPNRGENLVGKRSPPSTSPRYTHKRQPSK